MGKKEGAHSLSASKDKDKKRKHRQGAGTPLRDTSSSPQSGILLQSTSVRMSSSAVGETRTMTLAPAHEFIKSQLLNAQTSETQVLTSLQGLVEVLHGFLFRNDFFPDLDSTEAEGWLSHLGSYLQMVCCLREQSF